MTAWPGELQATKKPTACLQYSHKPGWKKVEDLVEGSEDCLYLNIYVPDREGEPSLLPVVFWIYGGAFTHGSVNVDGPKYLMDENVIFVAANYRVGPLGMMECIFLKSSVHISITYSYICEKL